MLEVSLEVGECSPHSPVEGLLLEAPGPLLGAAEVNRLAAGARDL